MDAAAPATARRSASWCDAQLLGLTEDAVKQRLSRGRQRLRDELARVLEETLERTRPGAAFTAAVVAALPALVAPPAAAAATGALAGKGAAAKLGGAAGLGAVIGPAVGMAGAAIGVKAALASAKSPRERRFLIRMTVAVGLLAALFVVVELVGLLAYRSIFAAVAVQVPVVLLYVVALVWLIVVSNRRYQQIQREEGTWLDPTQQLAEIERLTPGAIYGALAGAIGGGLIWLVILCAIAGDLAVAAAVAVAGGLLIAVSGRAALRDRQRVLRITTRATLAVLVINLVVVNLEWERFRQAYRLTRTFSAGADWPLWTVNVLVVGVLGWVLGALWFADRKLQRALPATPSPDRRDS